jgi:hypothetical protein
MVTNLANKPMAAIPMSIMAGCTACAVTASQRRQAYWGRMWRWTKNRVGFMSRCSVMSSRILVRLPPQCSQVYQSGSWRCSIRVRYPGKGWRPAWGLLGLATVSLGSLSVSASSSVSMADRSVFLVSSNTSRYSGVMASLLVLKRMCL